MTSAVRFEKILKETLRSFPEISSIVGKKVFPVVIPKGTPLPCISFQRIEGRPANTLLGSSGLEQIVIQIDTWSLKYAEAKNLAIAVRKAIPASGAEWGAHLTEDRDLYEQGSEGTGYYRVMMRFTVWFLENATD